MIKKIDLKHLLKIIALTIFLIILIGIYFYIENAEPLKQFGINKYSLWYNLLNGHYGQYLIILSPILISMAITYNFFRRIKSGIYKDISIRKKYPKYLTKEILWMYFESLLLFPLLFILLFLIISIFIQSSEIVNYNSLTIYSFAHLQNISPLNYILIETLSVYLFSIVIVNISIILTPFIKKFYLLLISLFIIVNLYNFGVANLIDYLLGVNSFNIYNGYMLNNDIYLDAVFLHMIILIIGTIFVIYFVYKNQERLTKTNG